MYTGRLHHLIFLAVVVAAMVNPIDFKTSAEVVRKTSASEPVLLFKLLVSSVAIGIGLIGFGVLGRARRWVATIPGAILWTMGGLFIVSGIIADPEVANVGRVSSIVYVGYLAFVMVASSILGFSRFIVAMITGTSMFLVATWMLYLLKPELGTFVEQVGGGETVERMGGTSHPNHIGKLAMSVFLFSASTWLTADGSPRRRRLRRTLATAGIALGLATVAATISRTAMLAGVAASMTLIVDRITSRTAVLAVAAAGMAATIGLLIISLTGGGDLDAARFTKSGDVNEITSVTGRTDIWAEALEFIARRPLIGHGINTAASLLSANATATHNLVLHVTFSGGVIAGMLVIVLLGWSAWRVFALLAERFRGRGYDVDRAPPWVAAVLTYVLVSGFVEDTVLEVFPATLTLIWIASLLLASRPVDTMSQMRIGTNS